MKGKHYNTITYFVPYKNIFTYAHNKIFTIFPNYLLPIRNYYLQLNLTTYYLLPIILMTYYLGYIPTFYYLF
jgi:hypothetical protein